MNTKELQEFKTTTAKRMRYFCIFGLGFLAGYFFYHPLPKLPPNHLLITDGVDIGFVNNEGQIRLMNDSYSINKTCGIMWQNYNFHKNRELEEARKNGLEKSISKVFSNAPVERY